MRNHYFAENSAAQRTLQILGYSLFCIGAVRLMDGDSAGFAAGQCTLFSVNSIEADLKQSLI